jgi:hypothetical protein
MDRRNFLDWSRPLLIIWTVLGVGPRRVLLTRGFLNKRPNDTERIYLIQNRLSGRQLKGRRARIYYSMFLCWKSQQTRQW